MGLVRIGILEDLGVEKHVWLIKRTADEKTFHSRLVLQAVIPVIIDQRLDTLEIAFDNGSDVNDITHC